MDIPDGRDTLETCCTGVSRRREASGGTLADDARSRRGQMAQSGVVDGVGHRRRCVEYRRQERLFLSVRWHGLALMLEAQCTSAFRSTARGVCRPLRREYTAASGTKPVFSLGLDRCSTGCQSSRVYAVTCATDAVLMWVDLSSSLHSSLTKAPTRGPRCWIQSFISCSPSRGRCGRHQGSSSKGLRGFAYAQRSSQRSASPGAASSYNRDVGRSLLSATNLTGVSKAAVTAGGHYLSPQTFFHHSAQ